MLELQAVAVVAAAVEHLTLDRRTKHRMMAAAGYIMSLGIVEVVVAVPVAGLLR